MVEFKIANCFYIVINGKNDIYHVAMNWQDAEEMTNFYNKTIHDEGKFTYQEVDPRQKLFLEGLK